MTLLMVWTDGVIILGSDRFEINPNLSGFFYLIFKKHIYAKINLMQNVFLKTERLTLRYITQNDFEELKIILQDKNIMYAWEYDFTDKDVQEWIEKNLKCYKKYNLGFFIISENTSGKVIGQAALKPDIIENNQYYEIGYILKKEYRHKGYATEAVKALKEYAFNTLNLNEVIFDFNLTNEDIEKIKLLDKGKTLFGWY